MGKIEKAHLDAMKALQDAKKLSEIPEEVVKDIKECHRRFQREHQENENTFSNKTQKVESDGNKSDLQGRKVKSFLKWLASDLIEFFIVMIVALIVLIVYIAASGKEQLTISDKIIIFIGIGLMSFRRGVVKFLKRKLPSLRINSFALSSFFIFISGWIVLVGLLLKSVMMKDIVTMKEKKEVLISEKKVDEAQSSNDVFQEPAAPIQESASDFYYKYYHNSRFDFEIYYPSFFDEIKLPTNGDGCRFIRDEQTYLSVFGSNNVFDETLEGKYKECKAKQPVYCRMKNDWLVVSDYTEDGRIYYEKTVLRNGAFLTATLYFPPEEKPFFAEIIPKIFTDFPGK